MSVTGIPGSGPASSFGEHQKPFDQPTGKVSRGTSCLLCQQRKVRCDRNKPCANCVKAKVECRVAPPQPPRRRKKRLQERDLIDRLKRYEALLTEHGVNFEPIGQEARSDGPHGDEIEDLENGFHDLKTSIDTDVPPSVDSSGEKPSSSIFALHKEFQATQKLIVQDSSDDEVEGSTIHRAFDNFFSNADGFPFTVGGSSISVTRLHPNPIQIFQLWQLYIDNVNSLLKITHVPTVQPQILQAASALDKMPKNIEAFMFGVYVMAITSMDERHVQSMFSESKQQLLTRYLPATQQTLVNAGFMRVDDPLVLQAFVLYLFAVRWFLDPRQVFCMIGLAVRIAQRMGLHRDPGGYGLPPFEVEQRRRLWWTIVGYDRRLAEMTGSTVTALSSGVDCKMPLNVNDSDLHVDGKEVPAPHTGPTEMVFALARIELFMAVATNSNRHRTPANSTETKGPPTKGEGRSGDTGPTIRLAIPDSPTYTLEGFCAHIEGTYLSHCDRKIPLHLFTLTMTRQALRKMRVMNFLVRMNNAEAMPFQEVEREDALLQATEMVEYDSLVHSSESLSPFRWYARNYFPFLAYMFLLQDLRYRISGPTAERAWSAITANYDLWGFPDNFHNPMHRAFKNSFVKAWGAHESAQRAAGKEVSTPRFITIMQEEAEQHHRERAGKQESSGSSQAFNAGSDNLGMMPGGSSAVPMGIGGGPLPGDDGGMDWSYMGQGYQDYQDPSPPFNESGNIWDFGLPMGGGGPSMFGN